MAARSLHPYQVWVGLASLVGSLVLGFYFRITATEWMFIIVAYGLALMAEAFNTAIEITIDRISPEQHQLSRDAKDVAAGAALIIFITTYVLAGFIFLPYIV